MLILTCILEVTFGFRSGFRSGFPTNMYGKK